VTLAAPVEAAEAAALGDAFPPLLQAVTTNAVIAVRTIARLIRVRSMDFLLFATCLARHDPAGRVLLLSVVSRFGARGSR